MESINEKIKRLRIESGVNQAEVARSAGIKQSSYASIEKGDTKSITIEVGKGIAKALKISFNELFEIESEELKEEFSEKLKEITEALEKMAENAKKDKTIIDLLERIITFQTTSMISSIYTSADVVLKRKILGSRVEDVEKLNEILLEYVLQLKNALILGSVFNSDAFEKFENMLADRDHFDNKEFEFKLTNNSPG
jgi:transcriptional regulator with XRE-family HTH domain